MAKAYTFEAGMEHKGFISYKIILLTFYYQEPAWVPVHGSGWATKEPLEYIKDPGPCGNERASQALFDYNGNVLTAKLIRDYKPVKDGKKS